MGLKPDHLEVAVQRQVTEEGIAGPLEATSAIRHADLLGVLYLPGLSVER